MGLIAISPLSQEILVPFINNYTTSGIDTRFFYFKPYDINGRSALQGSGMPPKMNGLTKNAYITTSSFAQAATGSKSVPLYTCPNQAIRCEFKNVSFISTTMSCTEITENDKAIALRDGTDPTLIILKEYFTNLNISYAGKTKYFPMFLYAPEMLGRTYYDLLNYTEPLLPGLNIKSLFADKFIYDPQYRPYVGDQQFVMAYNKKNLFSRIANNYTEMGFKKCFFTSSLNTVGIFFILMLSLSLSLSPSILFYFFFFNSFPFLYSSQIGKHQMVLYRKLDLKHQYPLLWTMIVFLVIIQPFILMPLQHIQNGPSW
ncbi:uncharacterized protein BX663DRAFT_5624 [Cokeromyces recurvatus]|uniref:uncharacterized protein n=1 Tax=Cokeromyces recurvatus TaxID=90255 RepID=UPI00221E9B3D|nr:uncharacterized protein BX663DRAFT_5624 [Cokeromyces recurvatus]KAI7907615.1 hypothetical protein BX663DRAFT_5624 [Cokeromyces recurvatus]